MMVLISQRDLDLTLSCSKEYWTFTLLLRLSEEVLLFMVFFHFVEPRGVAVKILLSHSVMV